MNSWQAVNKSWGYRGYMANIVMSLGRFVANPITHSHIISLTTNMFTPHVTLSGYSMRMQKPRGFKVGFRRYPWHIGQGADPYWQSNQLPN